MAADGSIIIDTHLDTSGISSSINEVQAAFKDLAESVKGISQKIDSVLNEGIEQLMILFLLCNSGPEKWKIL